MLSEVIHCGHVALPEFTGTRVMMMPFALDAPSDSLPATLTQWKPALESIVTHSKVKKGVGYLTIDEAHVKAGTTHRRPGLHVDGIGPNGTIGGWGGGGGSWGQNGMLVAASHVGCRAWEKNFDGQAVSNGDCAHLRDQCCEEDQIVMGAGEVYWCGPLAVHESLTMTADCARQFVRVSMPSDAPWYEGYTVNPLGIQPTGPIHAARRHFMEYRP